VRAAAAAAARAAASGAGGAAKAGAAADEPRELIDVVARPHSDEERAGHPRPRITVASGSSSPPWTRRLVPALVLAIVAGVLVAFVAAALLR